MKPPFAEIEFAPPLVERRDRGDGSFELFSPVPLQPYAKSLAHLLRLQAEMFPKKDFLAERDASAAWRRVTFGEASRRADSIAQALLERGCAPDRPVMILSGNGIDHALIMLGAFVAGIPVVPVSVAYSLMSQDFDKLKQSLAEGLKPYALFNARQQMNVQARDMYQKAMADYAAAEDSFKKLQP